MLVSIALPVYRQESFVPFALDSIMAQLNNVELAVMDATPDESVQNIINNYLNLIIYNRHGPDSGQTSAIQEGWNNTQGEIISWLCADDYYFPYTVEAVRQVFLNHAEIDVVYGDSVFVDEMGQFLGYFPAIQKNISSITTECCISQPSCFVRRSAFEKIGGKLNENLHYTMDWDLWIRLYQYGANFYYLNKPLSVVRMYEGTKTSSRSLQRFLEIGSHLFKNAGPFAATRSLLGFYYQDLSTTKINGFERLILKLLNLYRDSKNINNKLINKDNFNYGFYKHSNIVSRQIDIYLPWYKSSGPSEFTINCDLELEPIAYLNGIRIESENAGFCYKISELDLSSRVLHLRLTSVEDKLWHLYDVKFI